jgi:hypothetical protein
LPETKLQNGAHVAETKLAAALAEPGDRDPVAYATQLIASGQDPVVAFLHVGFSLEQIAASGYDISRYLPPEVALTGPVPPWVPSVEWTADHDGMLAARETAQRKLEQRRLEAGKRTTREQARARDQAELEAIRAESVARLRPPARRSAAGSPPAANEAGAPSKP